MAKIYHGVEQGSGDWFTLRLGIPTASEFHKIVTPAKCDYSAQARPYAYRLVAERLLNSPAESVEGQMWMERGKEFEPKAVQQYEFVTDAKTLPVSFVTTDDGTLGCSPDRLVLGDKRAGLEIKCPAPHTHLGYLLDGPGNDYRPQVQGQMLVAEFERNDFYSYHPRMPECLVQTYRDEAYIKKLADHLERFKDELEKMTERARELGAFQPYERTLSPIEKEEAAELGTAYREEVLWGPY